MQNDNFQKYHLRGSSSLQGIEKRPDESVTLPVLKHIHRSKVLPTDTSGTVSDIWARGRGSVLERPGDSLHGDLREELTAREENTGSQPGDERSLYDGGESGEVVS